MKGKGRRCKGKEGGVNGKGGYKWKGRGRKREGGRGDGREI